MVDPLDYESVLVQKKTQIVSDVLRDMLQFPTNDFQISTIRRQGRTLFSTVPENARKEYEEYSGNFRQLPNKVLRPEKLAAHLFEVDEDVDKDEKGGVSKHGWLFKGNMNSAISVTMRDEKTSKEPKGTIFLDSCMGVVQDKSTYLLAAEGEAEMDEWVATLNRILHNEELSKTDPSTGTFHDSFQSARDVESKMRSETRLKLFTLDPDTQKLDLSGIQPEVAQFEEKFGHRVLVSCHNLSFSLQTCITDQPDGPTTNVEPFYVLLSLFDVQNGRKISADFHVDLNHPLGVFSVTCPHPDIFLVARVEKVLQGGVAHCTEPYMKSSDSAKVAQKVLKNARLACSRLRQYRMPFRLVRKALDSSKLSDEDMFKLLADFRKPEKMAKLPVILGNLDVTIDNVAPDITNCVTPSYLPVKGFEGGGGGEAAPPGVSALLEVEEFVPCIAKCSQPFTTFNNHLYVYPKHLKYDGQKAFAKEDAPPIKCIYARPGGPLFTKQAFAAVLHHQQNPEFYDEIKIELPVQLHEKHHLLFTFYHVSLGSAWLPLLRDGRVVMSEQQAPVAANLPPGYLGGQDAVAKNSGPDIKWVDGGKALFKVSTHLVSTVYTQDQHLHNFFHHCQIMESSEQASLEGELVKYLKSLHAMESHVMVNFLSTVLHQLFRVLTRAKMEEVAVNVTRVMVHIVAQCHEEGLEHYLRSYIKTVHEELVKAMTAILKPSTDFLTSNKLLKHSWYFFEALVKSMAQYLMESDKVKTLVNMLAPHITQKYKENLDAARNANHSLAVFIKRCFTFMDRGFVFKQINNYMNCFMPGDQKLDYSLTDDFCRNHFLVGLLLREVGGALQELGEVRQIAIQVLKSLMMKHTFDDRYAAKSQQARLSTLYLPLFGLLLENVHRLDAKESVAPSGNNTPGSRASLVSTDSCNSLLDKSRDRANSLEKAPQGAVLRCDKLEREEVKSLLMCFLHVLKSMSQEGAGLVAADRRSLTLPVSRNRAGLLHARLQQLGTVENAHTLNNGEPVLRPEVTNQCLLEANVSTEVCLTVLDTLSVFIMGFKSQLSSDMGHNPLMKKVFQVHLCFLQIPQSETALKQVFTSLRTFIYKFPCTFFDGRADMCAALCYEILKCCNSKLGSIRTDGAQLLYFLMKSNFDYTGRRSFLIADVIGIGGTRFQQSLSVINNCANGDKNIKHTAFPSDVKDLMKRIRTVLMATEQMKEHEDDPEMLVDLQYSLAKSYTSTPELRKTWLDSMARIHHKNGELSEAAMCYSTCGEKEVLMEHLEECADGLWKAERYELIADIYRLVIPIYEQRRDFE
ncbi:hypothetical protein NHX12_015085, partial [Muraenolepis orangiensis]